jgi:hypothetical protein
MTSALYAIDVCMVSGRPEADGSSVGIEKRNEQHKALLFSGSGLR